MARQFFETVGSGKDVSFSSLASLLHERKLYIKNGDIYEETALIDLPLALAPMAGVSDFAFRSLCLECGAGFAVGELVSVKGIRYRGLGSCWDLIYLGPCENRRTSIQLFGENAEDYIYALEKIFSCENLYSVKNDFRPLSIDINMGCPVPKVCKTGAGSALMKNVVGAEKIVKACCNYLQKYKIPVSVKFRKGYAKDEETCTDFALAMAEAGASMICIHGRTRDQMYSGKADWLCIAKAKDALKKWEAQNKHPGVLLLANGDIKDTASAVECLQLTGADGLQIGRAAQGRPWLFRQLFRPYEPTLIEQMNFVKRHFHALSLLKDESRLCREFRKTLIFYTRSFKKASKLRNMASSISTVQELEMFIDELIDTCANVQ